MSEITDAFIKDATTEYLSHRGEQPYRILRGGQQLWETHAPAIRAALACANRLSPAPAPAVPAPGSEAYIDSLQRLHGVTSKYGCLVGQDVFEFLEQRKTAAPALAVCSKDGTGGAA